MIKRILKIFLWIASIVIAFILATSIGYLIVENHTNDWIPHSLHDLQSISVTIKNFSMSSFHKTLITQEYPDNELVIPFLHSAQLKTYSDFLKPGDRIQIYIMKSSSNISESLDKAPIVLGLVLSNGFKLIDPIRILYVFSKLKFVHDRVIYTLLGSSLYFLVLIFYISIRGKISKKASA